MAQVLEIEYQQQIRHLLGTINSQRRLIQALRADYRLIQVIVGKAISGEPVELQNTTECQDCDRNLT